MGTPGNFISVVLSVVPEQDLVGWVGVGPFGRSCEVLGMSERPGQRSIAVYGEVQAALDAQAQMVTPLIFAASPVLSRPWPSCAKGLWVGLLRLLGAPVAKPYAQQTWQEASAYVRHHTQRDNGRNWSSLAEEDRREYGAEEPGGYLLQRLSWQQCLEEFEIAEVAKHNMLQFQMTCPPHSATTLTPAQSLTSLVSRVFQSTRHPMTRDKT